MSSVEGEVARLPNRKQNKRNLGQEPEDGNVGSVSSLTGRVRRVLPVAGLEPGPWPVTGVVVAARTAGSPEARGLSLSFITPAVRRAYSAQTLEVECSC